MKKKLFSIILSLSFLCSLVLPAVPVAAASFTVEYDNQINDVVYDSVTPVTMTARIDGSTGGTYTVIWFESDEWGNVNYSGGDIGNGTLTLSLPGIPEARRGHVVYYTCEVSAPGGTSSFTFVCLFMDLVLNRGTYEGTSVTNSTDVITFSVYATGVKGIESYTWYGSDAEGNILTGAIEEGYVCSVTNFSPGYNYYVCKCDADNGTRTLTFWVNYVADPPLLWAYGPSSITTLSPSESFIFDIDFDNVVGAAHLAWYKVDQWGTILDYTPLSLGMSLPISGIPVELVGQTQYYKCTINADNGFAEVYFDATLQAPDTPESSSESSSESSTESGESSGESSDESEDSKSSLNADDKDGSSTKTGRHDSSDSSSDSSSKSESSRNSSRPADSQLNSSDSRNESSRKSGPELPTVPTQSGGLGWLWIVIGVVLLALIILMIVLIIKNARKNKR